jgi:hypothetical protein
VLHQIGYLYHIETKQTKGNKIMKTYNIIENGKVIHTGSDLKKVQEWAFVLTNSQGRKVEVK